MVVYQVDIKYNKDINKKLYEWLLSHANQMLEYKGFIKYDLYEDYEIPSTYTVQYYLKDLPSLEDYLHKYSQKMRQKGIDLFGKSITVTRRILVKA